MKELVRKIHKPAKKRENFKKIIFFTQNMQEYGQSRAKTIENQVLIAYNDRNEEEQYYER